MIEQRIILASGEGHLLIQTILGLLGAYFGITIMCGFIKSKCFEEELWVDENSDINGFSYRALWIFAVALIINSSNDIKTVSFGVGLVPFMPMITIGAKQYER